MTTWRSQPQLQPSRAHPRQHKFALTLYTDYEHVFEKINPRLNCPVCGNPNGICRVEDQLDMICKVRHGRNGRNVCNAWEDEGSA